MFMEKLDSTVIVTALALDSIDAPWSPAIARTSN
jgi:hypothetical protein